MLRLLLLLAPCLLVQGGALALQRGSGLPADRESPATGPAPRPYGRVVALCVGVNDYPAGGIFEDLTFARRDADEVARLFEERYGYEAHTLLDKQASKEGILGRLRAIGEDLGEEDVFIFFFAGHGHTVTFKDREVDRREGFLVPYGAQIPLDQRKSREHVNRAAISGDSLRELVLDSAFRARHAILILDCCFAGMIASTRSSGLDSEGDSADLLARMLKRSRTALTAGTEDEESLEFPLEAEYQHGIFTYHLLQLLREEPAISVHELISPLYTGVRSSVREHYNPNADPNGRMMSPRLKHLEDTPGDFVFIERPVEDWLKRARSAAAEMGPAARPAARSAVSITEESVLEYSRAGRRAEADGYSLEDDPRWRERTRAAEVLAVQGDVHAMAVLYFAHAYGIGTPRNEEEAYRWAQESSEGRSELGAYALASAYKEGVGTDRNEAATRQLIQQHELEQELAVGALISLFGDSDELEEDGGGFAFLTALAALSTLSKEDPTLLALEIIETHDELKAQVASHRQDTERIEDLRVKIAARTGDLLQMVKETKDSELHERLAEIETVCRAVKSSLIAVSSRKTQGIRKKVADGFRTTIDPVDRLRDLFGFPYEPPYR